MAKAKRIERVSPPHAVRTVSRTTPALTTSLPPNPMLSTSDRLASLYKAASQASSALSRYVSVIRAINTIKPLKGRGRKHQAELQLHTKVIERNTRSAGESLEQLLPALGLVDSGVDMLSRHIFTLYRAGDEPFQIWSNGRGGFRVGSTTAINALVDVCFLVLMDNDSIKWLGDIKWTEPISGEFLRKTIPPYLQAAVPRWREAKSIDLPTTAELQNLSLRLNREGNDAVRTFRDIKEKRLPQQQQDLWDALDGHARSSKELAPLCGCQPRDVKSVVHRIRSKLGRDVIKTCGYDGYFRPDAPPS